MKRLIIGLIFIGALFPGIWLVAVSEETLLRLAENFLDRGDTRVEITDLKKGFFYNFSAGQVIIRRSDKTLLSLENVRGDINPFGLLRLRLPVSMSGEAAHGKISGKADILRRGTPLQIAFEDARLEEIPAFRVMGLDGRGLISGTMSLEKGAGNVRFEVKEMSLKNTAFDGISVPLDLFYTARGAMEIRAETWRIVSFSLDGNEIRARLKGKMEGGNLNLTMELMPEQAFIEKNPLFSLLEKYRISPGYYSVPVRKKLI
ncbi:MAG: type II secretion system protein GspN [Nitrospirae bacterium]|nr:type II secretion system protein GspN [Nitrospirota bacterium]